MTAVLRYAAFTSDPAGGNPAGVVLDGADLSEAQMQEIAAEVGYSESAFVVGVHGERDLDLRFFSPLAEVAFCGHATIATAVALAERTGSGALRFGTAAGPIEVETAVVDGRVHASLRSVPVRSHAADPTDVLAALSALGWDVDDLDPHYPPHVSFAGNDHLVLGVRSRERLADLDYDFDALTSLMTARGWTTVQLFWPEGGGVFHSRNPFPVGGVVEDPATGAAAAALGGYLRATGHLSAPGELLIIQGEDMGRRSQLHVTVHPGEPGVTVAGTAVTIPG